MQHTRPATLLPAHSGGAHVCATVTLKARLHACPVRWDVGSICTTPSLGIAYPLFGTGPDRVAAYTQLVRYRLLAVLPDSVLHTQPRTWRGVSLCQCPRRRPRCPRRRCPRRPQPRGLRYPHTYARAVPLRSSHVPPAPLAPHVHQLPRVHARTRGEQCRRPRAHEMLPAVPGPARGRDAARRAERVRRRTRAARTRAVPPPVRRQGCPIPQPACGSEDSELSVASRYPLMFDLSYCVH
jgi:hypothetical protein